mmetsp:Transcript_22173/g.54546  ORF Transcript_22173/g.54546 Transcript_22173/m.54546 type:complete len:204 (+) Transcript_22173:1486-2097(+)
MRPTKGEMSVALASAHATAWPKPKSRVMLQWMPSASSFSHALMPSHVEAILIKMRSFSMPSSLYSLMKFLAFLMEASLSKDRQASTSVDTRPGTIFRISQPNLTDSRSHTSLTRSSPFLLVFLAPAMAASSKWAYSGICAAWNRRVGLVVASCGLYFLSWLKSPVSATTMVICLSRSSAGMSARLAGDPPLLGEPARFDIAAD